MSAHVVQRRRRLLTLILSFGLASVAVAALLPVRFDSREERFEIPKGTWARRMAGDKVEILPPEIHLVLGIRNVLHLQNLDDVPQIFGPTLLMPGQSFRLPFEVASENLFACTAHASGQLAVIVEETPDSPWRRLRWRAQVLVRRISRTLHPYETQAGV
jgi:hypothetical protein